MPAESPYATVAPFGRAAPTNVSENAVADRLRVTAYDTYTDIFNNVPTIFKAVLKEESGQEVFRRLVPSARTIVEATNRYLANGLDWVALPPVPTSAVDSAAGAAAVDVADESVNETMSALNALFTREAFMGKFMSLKRWMLVRGDAMFHITADPSKPEGSRLSIREIDPSTYFAIEDPADSERVLGCYLVNLVTNDNGEEIAARLEYQRILDADRATQFGAPLNTVFMRLSFWEADGWDGRASEEDLKPVATPARFNVDRFMALLTGTTLPPVITALPVYHFRNSPRGGEIYGVSELQGIETLICGVNQTITDQEVTIALQGLGVYWTDSGRPRDPATGREIPWEIAPASMLELQAGKSVGRLSGVDNIQTSLDHIGLFDAKMRETSGTPEIAVGAVDVKVAESGVSRAIQFAPVIAKNAEKEEEIKGRLNQLLFDLLTGWLPAFDGYTDNGVRVTAEFGPALPVNAKEIVDNVVALVTAKVASAAWGRTFLTDKLGYQFSATEADNITAEAAAALDATGVRLDAAVAGAPDAAPPEVP